MTASESYYSLTPLPFRGTIVKRERTYRKRMSVMNCASHLPTQRFLIRARRCASGPRAQRCLSRGVKSAGGVFHCCWTCGASASGNASRALRCRRTSPFRELEQSLSFDRAESQVESQSLKELILSIERSFKGKEDCLKAIGS